MTETDCVLRDVSSEVKKAVYIIVTDCCICEGLSETVERLQT